MAAATTARGVYAKTDRVRDRILDAAAEIFGEVGYRAATTKGVARRAGMSEGGLAHHFAGKSELLAGVLERHEAIAALRYAGEASVGPGAMLMMLDVVRQDLSRPGIVELHAILSAEAAVPEHPAHGHYQDRYRRGRLFVRLALEQLEGEGSLVGALSADDAAAAYFALSDGLQLQWLYEREAIDVNGILRRFLESIVPSFAAVTHDGKGV